MKTFISHADVRDALRTVSEDKPGAWVSAQRVRDVFPSEWADLPGATVESVAVELRSMEDYGEATVYGRHPDVFARFDGGRS